MQFIHDLEEVVVFLHHFDKYLLVSLIIIFFTCLANVHAAGTDNLTTDGFNDDYLELNDEFNDVEASSIDNELLTKTYSLNGGKFSDIQNLIDKASDGDTISLSGKFKADGAESIIKIKKKLIITSKTRQHWMGNIFQAFLLYHKRLRVLFYQI